jgi:DNA anti-recombination protein RmuC
VLLYAYFLLHRVEQKRDQSRNINEFVSTPPQLKPVLDDMERANGISENALSLMVDVKDQQKELLRKFQNLLGQQKDSTGNPKNIISQQEDLKSSVDSVSRNISKLEESLNSISSSTQSFERVLLGPQTKGALGEAMVRERLLQLPGDWIQHNVGFPDKTKVEFSLLTPDRRLVPIDSKWVGTPVLNELGKQTDPQMHTIYIKFLEREVKNRSREILKYIDDYRTLGFGIAAIPDPIFELTWRVHSELAKENIVVISYSLLVPYLLLLVKTVFTNAQSTQAWQSAGILNRSFSQIQAIQEIIDTKLRATVRSVGLQQSEYSSHNQTMKEFSTKLSQIQDDLKTMQSSLPSSIAPLFQTDIAAMPNTLHQSLSTLREILLGLPNSESTASKEEFNPRQNEQSSKDPNQSADGFRPNEPS